MVCVEGNLHKHEKNLNIDYKGYNLQSKFLDGSEVARLSVIKKSDLSYERLTTF